LKPAALRLDEIPPLSVPLRFHLTAPWFGVLAGAILVRDGDLWFASRWMPGVMAATHLLTLGFFAMVMVGSLFQVLPVLGGGPVPGARWLAPLAHIGLLVGVLVLGAAFEGWGGHAFLVAAVLLSLSLGIVAIAVGSRLLRSESSDALFLVRLAVLALLVTVSVGVVMALARAFPSWGIPYRSMTDAHLRFGLVGAILLLVVGVSVQVLPMFHVTPGFDSVRIRLLGSAIFASLVGLMILEGPANAVVAGVLAIGACGYALLGLRELTRRRRRRIEPLVVAWQGGFVVLLVAASLGFLAMAGDFVGVSASVAAASGWLACLLFGFGFAMTVVLGMSHKIIAFLAFLHLQRRCLARPSAVRLLPPMNHFVTDRSVWWLLGLHASTVVLLTASVLLPSLASVAGWSLILEMTVMGRNLSIAAWRYRRAAIAIGSSAESAA
jgi:hypothetical protein